MLVNAVLISNRFSKEKIFLYTALCGEMIYCISRRVTVMSCNPAISATSLVLLFALLLWFQPLFLVGFSCGPPFIGDKRPEEPKDRANSYADPRTPERKYQREQITGSTQGVVAAPGAYQPWRNRVFQQVRLIGGEPPEQVIHEIGHQEKTRIDSTGHPCNWCSEIHRNQLGWKWHGRYQQEQEAIGEEEWRIGLVNQLEHGVMAYPHDKDGGEADKESQIGRPALQEQPHQML